jgi:hypothetical protein
LRVWDKIMAFGSTKSLGEVFNEMARAAR